MAIESSIIFLSSFDVPNSQATAATVAGGVIRFRIDEAAVTNYSGTDRQLTVYVLQNSESVADVRKGIDALTIPANTTISLFEIVGRALDTGGIINAFASAASALSLSITGTNTT